MNSIPLLVFSLVAFGLAYRFYGAFLAQTFAIDPLRKTPALEVNDGQDFVPAKNWWVLFGHHFSSICGAGPIVGPALACVYWGWGVALIWLIVGGIFMGAVSDFSSLVISMRTKGESIAQVSGIEISKRVRLIFSIFLWIALVLVIAVFSLFGAKTFIQEPDAIIPSIGLIPTAILVGWLMYRTRLNNAIGTVIGLVILIALLIIGTHIEVVLNAYGSITPTQIWIGLLLVYCFIASVVPVQVLLQPRDYMASFILFAVIITGIVSILFVHPNMQSPAFIAWKPDDFAKAGPLWPMLFVTVACGAISGFHSLVSSGTTCKQIASETHACRIGYGGMLLESIVGVMVLIMVAAGLQRSEVIHLLNQGGPISVFSHGYGNISQIFLGDYGKSFAVLGLNAFILTTLDSATRITRYLTTEIFGIQNKYVATAIVIVAAGGLAFSGQWNILWPVFGASNQLIAAIALLIAACWLMHRGKRFRFVLIPACLMMVTTLASFSYLLKQSLHLGEAEGPEWILITLCGILIILATIIFTDAFTALQGKKLEQAN